VALEVPIPHTIFSPGRLSGATAAILPRIARNMLETTRRVPPKTLRARDVRGRGSWRGEKNEMHGQKHLEIKSRTKKGVFFITWPDAHGLGCQDMLSGRAKRTKHAKFCFNAIGWWGGKCPRGGCGLFFMKIAGDGSGSGMGRI
jgi:hypothetical protein